MLTSDESRWSVLKFVEELMRETDDDAAAVLSHSGWNNTIMPSMQSILDITDLAVSNLAAVRLKNLR